MITLTRHPKYSDQQGFTIVELMIATLIFAVIMLTVTYGIIQVGKTYNKGITETKTQATARAVLETISKDIQFNGGIVNAPPPATPATTTYAICVGSNRYSVLLHQELLDDNSHHGLVQDTTAGCDIATPIANIGGGVLPVTTPPARELLGPHMRLAFLDVVPSGSLYRIHIRLVYGADDVICSPSIAGDCDSPGNTSGPNNLDILCKSRAGSQFCAVSDLTTTVQKRTNF